MIGLTFLNVLIYFSQVLIVIAAAAIGLLVCRVSNARTRLAYWRGAVLACLILPFVPARAAHFASGASAGTEVTTSVSASIAFVQASTTPALSAAGAGMLWVLLFGAAARAVWLGLGFVRLRRLRLDSTPVVAGTNDDLDGLKRAIAPRVDLRWHDEIAQPLAFGAWRPVVLLPPSVADLPAEARRAIVCHELLHVARHDWAWMIVEEVLRTAFWFHPAMLWALGQVQLSREQVVDQMVVAVTNSRVPYMNALMMYADADARSGLTSAIPFVRSRQLAPRLKQLSEERTMSSLRLGFTSVALAGVLIGSSIAVASAMPLRPRLSAGQDKPKRVPKAITQVKPEYPAEAMDAGIKAEVTVKVDISAAGEVTGARLSSGTLISTGTDASTDATKLAVRRFIEAAEAAARQWKFEPGDSDTTADIEFTFTMKSHKGVDGGVAGGVRGGVLGGVAGGVVGDVVGGVTGGVFGGVTGGVTGTARPGELPKQDAGPLRVGGNIKQPRKVRHVAPVYPDDAKAAHVAGVVILEITIGKDGSVSNARILRSVPMLDQAALDAVYQWAFEPTLLNGAPVEVVMTVTVNFTVQ